MNTRQKVTSITAAKLAPRPSRKGIQTGIYDILEANGRLSESEVRKWFPAILAPGQTIKTTQIHNGLYQGCRAGYFIRNDDGTYEIAPKSTYDTKQAQLHLKREANRIRLARGERKVTRAFKPRESLVFRDEIPAKLPFWGSKPSIVRLALIGSGVVAGAAIVYAAFQIVGGA